VDAFDPPKHPARSFFMHASRNQRPKSRNRQVRQLKTANRPRRRDFVKAHRKVAPRNRHNLYDAPEIWHQPGDREDYRVLVLDPGKGYRHVVSPDQIRSRLARLPQRFLRGLEVVQLSTMTRKKGHLPCYGLQWGCAIYLYPFCETLEEHFDRPPPQQLVIETRMYGARWDHPESNLWRLIWTESSARDYQLNNILIHELGHMVDTWNSKSVDQERFAEWFAIEFGYRRTGGQQRRRPRRRKRRRHG
jgi:hypothetical protein